MNPSVLIPVDGCWVRRRNASPRIGRVIGHRIDAADRVTINVDWGASSQQWVPLTDLRCGFQRDWTVQDVPLSATRRSLGSGKIIGYRQLGRREQVLIQLDHDGRSLWLPYENLRRIKDARTRYVRVETQVDDHPERFRLKLLAHALENWNKLTGSLDRLDIDPLPHQIQLVHRILSSGNYNWLIADDVGLGKTIEVGLLLAALKRAGRARRVLIVCPAGLTRQWQDELRFKFDQEYLIYGNDVSVNSPAQWKVYDHVIVSIDRAKLDAHMNMFRQAGSWDVVVFDEGHKLTRHASGERAQRYRFAETLRPLADAFLLLSGTPHQGYRDRFVALLELVRPDLAPQIATIEANPEVVAELILRNRKTEVTDADGNFIFKGHRVYRLGVEPSEETRIFQRLLRAYLLRGYKAGDALAGATGRAIGFVMTTYRKLASSSIAAIEHALRLRLERLETSTHQTSNAFGEPLSIEDLTEGGDEQDNLLEGTRRTQHKEFFEFEQGKILELLSHAASVKQQDEKLRIFLDDAVSSIVAKNEKLLVFTEYRATQSYLQHALERRFPDSGEVLLINGSMTLDDKLDAIRAFNEGANRFLISTEAGGEGLNLHRSCHVMVNYDMPWNPARLVQRIGRLYRYGQSETVLVFNLHAEDSFDNQAISLMMERVMQIAEDMAPVGEEYSERLHADILGDVLETLDMADILRRATVMRVGRTEQEIKAAIARAQTARQLQDEILAHASGYDPNALRGTLGFSMRHVELFVRSILPLLGARVESESYGRRILDVRLPEHLRGEFPEFGQRTAIRVTTDRRMAQRFPNVVLLDFEAEFFQFLIREAKSQDFDGVYASVQTPSGEPGTLAAYKLRWQNDQGDPLTEELVTLFGDSEGRVTVNPSFLVEWIESTATAAPVPTSDRSARPTHLDAIEAAAHGLLASESTRFKHPNGIVQLATADFVRVSQDEENRRNWE